MTIDFDTFSSDTEFHGVKGLIQIDDIIIVIRRDTLELNAPFQVDLPGGGREQDESPFETLHREIREMLHIPIEAEDIIYSKRYPHTHSKKDDTFFMVTKRLEVDPKSIIFGEKGLMYYAMTVHDLLQHPDGVDKQKQRIIEYLNMVKKELR